MSTPETEMEQFYSSTQGEAVEAAPAETPAAPEAKTTEPAQTAAPETSAAPAPDFWSEVVNDPELPKSQQGKTRKEIWEMNKRAVQEAHQAGFQKNEAERRAQILAAQLEVAQRQIAQVAPQRGRQQLGGRGDTLEEIAPQIPEMFDNIPTLVEQKVQQVREQEIAPIAGALFNMQAEAAREKGREALDFDKGVWEEAKGAIGSIIAYNQWDARDHRAWQAAGEMYLQHARKLVPQQVQSAAVTSPPAGNSKPGAAKTEAKKISTTGNKAMDRQIHEMLGPWNENMKKTGGPTMSFDDIAALINGDPSRMTGEW